MKIGIFGGSFNPIHNGHIMSAKSIQQKHQFDRFIFIPTYYTPLKDPKSLEAAEHRKAMIELAITEIPNAECSTIEIERGGTSYAVDTFTEIKRTLQEEDELYWIVGVDAFLHIREWKDYPKLFSMGHCIVITSPGHDFPLGLLPGTLISKYQRGDDEDYFVNKQGLRIYFHAEATADIHSSEIRERLKTKSNIAKLLPPEVLDYITEHKLYGLR